MSLGTIIKPARQSPDAAIPHQSQQSHAHGVRRAKIEKILGREHPRLAVLPDALIYGLRQIHGYNDALNMLKKQPCIFNRPLAAFELSIVCGKALQPDMQIPSVLPKRKLLAQQTRSGRNEKRRAICLSRFS